MTDASPPPRRDSPPGERDRSRALSEVLSYALVFSLIVISIAIVTVGGLGSLQDARTSEQVDNADRAYDVLHDNMADIYAEGAPSRATEISLGQTEVYFGDNVTMRVTVDGDDVALNRTIRPIVFRIDGQRSLVYEAGATIHDGPDGGLVLNEPPFVVSEDGGTGGGLVHLPVVDTTSPTVQSVGGGTVLVQGQSAEREVLASSVDGGSTIQSIRLETPRYDIWEDYFQEQGYCQTTSTVTGDPGAVTCTLDADHRDPQQLYVTYQRIAVELIQ